MLVRELERAERREKKKQIEDRWALMKWVTKYIDENEANWRNEKRKLGNEEKISVNEWDRLSENEKKEEIVETMKEKCKRKTNSWREWRPPAVHSMMGNPTEMQIIDSVEPEENVNGMSLNIVINPPKLVPPEAKNETIPPVKKYVQQTLSFLKIKKQREDNPRGGVLPQETPAEPENESPKEETNSLPPLRNYEMEIPENSRGGVLPQVPQAEPENETP